MNSKNSKTRVPAKSPAKSSVVPPPSPRHATAAHAKKQGTPVTEKTINIVPPSPPMTTAPIPKKVLRVTKESLQIQSGKEKISSENNTERKRGKAIIINSYIFVGPKKATSE